MPVIGGIAEPSSSMACWAKSGQTPMLRAKLQRTVYRCHESLLDAIAEIRCTKLCPAIDVSLHRHNTSLISTCSSSRERRDRLMESPGVLSIQDATMVKPFTRMLGIYAVAEHAQFCSVFAAVLYATHQLSAKTWLKILSKRIALRIGARNGCELR